jgi:hypothetical protein
VLLKYLGKGVHMHSFSEQSGCVFLDIESGETLSVSASESEIVSVLSDENTLEKSNELNTVVESLVDKFFLIPLDNKNTDAR